MKISGVRARVSSKASRCSSRFGYGPAHGTKGVAENLKSTEYLDQFEIIE
jgi:hypothetical protein